jgi:X-X-X-Leu-X-X-Gly heptad repeat protein
MHGDGDLQPKMVNVAGKLAVQVAELQDGATQVIAVPTAHALKTRSRASLRQLRERR